MNHYQVLFYPKKYYINNAEPSTAHGHDVNSIRMLQVGRPLICTPFKTVF